MSTSNSYEKTVWVNEQTALNAKNMNKIESAISDVVSRLNGFQDSINAEFGDTAAALQVDINANKNRIDNLESNKLKLETDMTKGRLKIYHEKITRE